MKDPRNQPQAPSKESVVNPALRSAGTGSARLEASSFSGPVPPPEVLRGYEQILPGSAERLFAAFEQEGALRGNLEMGLFTEESEVNRQHHLEILVGQTFGFLIALSAIGGSVWLGIKGQPWASASIGALGIGSIVYVFVKGRNAEPPKSK